MNLAQIRQSIQDKGYYTDTVQAQNSSINSVYREICGDRRWPFLEKQSTSITTTVGQSAYSLNAITDLQQVDAVRIERGTEYDPTEFLSAQDFRDLEHLDRDNGVPYFWTFVNNALHLYPRPDGVYTVTIDYIMTPADLSADGDVPILPTTHHDILVWGAIREIAYRERDWLGRQFAMEMYQLKLSGMTASLKQRQTASHVKSSGLYDDGRVFPWSWSW